MNEKMQPLYQSTSGSFGAIASAFVIESLQHMIVWLIVMFAVILADLISGLMKCYKLQQKIRPSRACRNTITKAVSYFAFVVAACMIDIAIEGEGSIERYCCAFVIVIEAISIGGNILRSSGYNLDANKLIELIVSRKLECDKSDVEGIIIKQNKHSEDDDDDF